MNEQYTRRVFAIGGTALLAVAANHVRSAYAFGELASGVETFSRSGDDVLDRALIQELKKIVHILEINPGFQYFNEMNAFAMQETIIEGTKGTVVIGLPLIKSLLKEDDGGVGVAGVCAHECAHIYHFDHGLDHRFENLWREGGGATSKSKSADAIEHLMWLELHADFLAGYYIGKRKGVSEKGVQRFSTTMYGFGNPQYREQTSHGTPGQRAAAGEKGYGTALTGASLVEAVEAGVSYVMNL